MMSGSVQNRFNVLPAIVIALCVAQAALADEADSMITLKGNWVVGWRYSLDGQRYSSVGIGGGSLSRLAEGNDRASREFRSYRVNRIAALSTGIAGGVMLAWPVLDNTWGDKTVDGWSALSVAGGIVAEAVAFLLASNSGDHLREGVNLLNAAHPSGARPGERPPAEPRFASLERATALSLGTGVAMLYGFIPLVLVETGVSYDRVGLKGSIKSILLINELGGEVAVQAYRGKKTTISAFGEGGYAALAIPGADGGVFDWFAGGGLEYARHFGGGSTTGAMFVRVSGQYCPEVSEPVGFLTVGIRGLRRVF